MHLVESLSQISRAMIGALHLWPLAVVVISDLAGAELDGVTSPIMAGAGGRRAGRGGVSDHGRGRWSSSWPPVVVLRLAGATSPILAGVELDGVTSPIMAGATSSIWPGPVVVVASSGAAVCILHLQRGDLSRVVAFLFSPALYRSKSHNLHVTKS